MAKNNFQRLEEEELSRLPDLPLGIKHNVHNHLDSLRTIGGVIDLYLSKLVDVFIAMTGGKPERPSNTFFSDSGHNPPTDPDSGGPGGPANG